MIKIPGSGAGGKTLKIRKEEVRREGSSRSGGRGGVPKGTLPKKLPSGDLSLFWGPLKREEDNNKGLEREFNYKRRGGFLLKITSWGETFRRGEK